MIDLTSELGVRASKRLQEEYVVWLTTVSQDGTPQPNPVWFFWDGKSLLIYSQPTSHKLKNISRNPRVSINFQADDEGGDVIVLTGNASIDKKSPPVESRYIEKYRVHIPKIGLTPESFAASYSTLIRVSPTSMRGF
ncbi:MAG: TIGR03667 family PPOX class F420-dependent oxidoreductase [Candidatus Bathyarchaeia archaeon]